MLWMEVAMAYFDVLSNYFSEDTEKHYKKPVRMAEEWSTVYAMQKIKMHCWLKINHGCISSTCVQ